MQRRTHAQFKNSICIHEELCLEWVCTHIKEAARKREDGNKKQEQERKKVTMGDGGE